MKEEKDIDEAQSDPVPVGAESAQTQERTSIRWLRLRDRRPVVIILAVTLLVVAVAAYLLWRSRQVSVTANEEPAPVVSVRVARAERQQIGAQVSALGTVFPREQATVSAKLSAQIRQMSLLKNRVVRAGEVIAVLESRDLQAQRSEAVAALTEARASARSLTTGTIPQTNAQDEKALRDTRANVAVARATYDRRRVLYEKGGISKKDLEASELQLTTTENDLRLAEQTIALRTKAINPNDRALALARVAQAEQHVATLDAQLSYATVRAPLTGIVTDQFQFEGEFAPAGGRLVNIADISEVIVKAPFADTVADRLKVGDPATVLPTDTPGEQMNGQVSLVSRASDPVNRAVEVWVTLGNEAGRLRAGGAAQVTISTNTKTDAVVVPLSAVTLDATNADEGTVMVVDAASVARETKVTVGIRSGDKIEINEGLQGGETVIIEGNFALSDGTRVEINEGSADETGSSPDEPKGKEP
jgi:HlyD family secretion protein